MGGPTISREFRDVDRAGSADHLVEYLDYVDSLPQFIRMKARCYRYLGIGEGDVILDAGCGPGNDTIRLARLAGSSGRVTGTDLSERMIAIARERSDGLALPVVFQAADIRDLPFPDASFDAVWTERILQVVEDPGRAIDELIRVLRPGGRILSTEPDWETFVCDPGSRETARTFFRFCSDQFPDGSTGRKLYRLFRERGLSDVVVHPEPLVLHDYLQASRLLNMGQFLSSAQDAGVIDTGAAAVWVRELAEAGAAGLFTFSGQVFAVSGRNE